MKTFSLIASLIILAVAISIVAVPDTTLSQSATQLACEGAGGTWTSGECVSDDGTTVEDIIKSVINVLLIIIGAASVIMIIIGGIRFVVSQGDSSAIESARNTILYAVIGIVVAFLAYAAVNFVTGSLEDTGSSTIESHYINIV
ncbi:MAG: hypothetical protein WD061_02990 [Candidatus Saccharimonadales bacterium]